MDFEDDEDFKGFVGFATSCLSGVRLYCACKCLNYKFIYCTVKCEHTLVVNVLAKFYNV